ncbi:MAG TPA: hypothetical protein VFW87_05705 [Pirellulales bacterium]|nr:hypothetical protein [Pirellulales bacterium]
MRRKKAREWAVMVRGKVVFTCQIKQVSEVYAESFNASADVMGIRVKAMVRRAKGGGQ